jgi:hypothetical protein
MCNLLDCSQLFVVMQLTIVFYIITATTSLNIEQSINNIFCFSSIVCFPMPVTTRSMMKRGLQPPPGSVGLLTCPTCCTEGNHNNSSSTDILLPTNSSSSVPELTDQCNVSLSSSKFDDPSILSSDDKFGISNFESFELPVLVPVEHACHNLELCHSSRMESDCQDTKPLVATNGDGNSSNQNTIMTMLSLISNRMMSSIHDMQHQLVQTDLKFSMALTRISEENEKFKLEIRNEVQSSGQPQDFLQATSLLW